MGFFLVLVLLGFFMGYNVHHEEFFIFIIIIIHHHGKICYINGGYDEWDYGIMNEH